MAINPFLVIWHDNGLSIGIVHHIKFKIMKTTAQKKINGVDIQALNQTIGALMETPEMAKFTFRAKNKWITAGHNRSFIQGFYGACNEDTSRETPFVYDNGEPPVLLGNNEGANPVEYILNALAGCMTTTIILHCSARGIELDSVESSLEGDIDVQGFLGLDDSVRNGYQDIRVKFDIQGDLTDEQREHIRSFAAKSPVFDILTNHVDVHIDI